VSNPRAVESNPSKTVVHVDAMEEGDASTRRTGVYDIVEMPQSDSLPSTLVVSYYYRRQRY
jgi:hypothetical protein